MAPKTSAALSQNIKNQLSAEQIDLIKSTIAKDATDDELKLFIYTATRVGLDPMAKQIHFVKRGGQMTIQTGIDGYRAIAERTGTLAGIDDAIYDDDKGIHPNKASVTVYRLVGGQKVSFTASARWNEYNQPSGFVWKKMPFLMLGKCAESLALRKAFPNDLSGLYTNEEMAQADPPPESKEAEVIDAPVEPPKELINREQVDRLLGLIKQLEAEFEEVNRFIITKKKVGMYELSQKQADEVITLLEERIKFKQEEAQTIEEGAKSFGGEVVVEPPKKE